MDLSHQGITGRQFELNRRGYDPDAVNAHLSEIAAAVGERERRIAELESTIESLQAKVQDANESEEALRLTLKAAAHAKEELLAGARGQAALMEREAAAKAESVVGQATAKANELVMSAEARAAAVDEEARSRAGEVAQAALAESQLLVERIQGMRERVAAAEDALAAIRSEAGPQMHNVREALDGALARAKEIAEDPSVLQRAAEEHVAAAAPVPVDQAPGYSVPEAQVQAGGEPQEHRSAAGYSAVPPVTARESQGAAPVSRPDAEPAAAVDAPQPSHAQEASRPDQVSQADEAPPPAEAPAAAAAQPPEAGPHLEVVGADEGTEQQESAADISNKVDRLLEELREVT